MAGGYEGPFECAADRRSRRGRPDLDIRSDERSRWNRLQKAHRRPQGGGQLGSVHLIDRLAHPGLVTVHVRLRAPAEVTVMRSRTGRSRVKMGMSRARARRSAALALG